MADLPIDSVEQRSGLCHPSAVRRRMDRMEYLLEDVVRIPGTQKRVGFDVILDFVPVGGSLVAGGMGAWLAWEARNLGVPKRVFARMAGNVALDTLLGAIPFVGFIPDYFFKSNKRNMKLVRRYLDQHHPADQGGASWADVRRD